MPQLNEQDIDRLALDACEITVFKSGSTVAYDLAGYDRTERIQVTPGSLQLKDFALEPTRPLPSQAKFNHDPYPARIAGFQRRAIFGPDDIGEQIGSRSITWNDGLGNGLYESLRIDRKYGLKHVLEAPVLGFDLPYLPQDWDNFQKIYPAAVERFLTDLHELEPVYGGPLARAGDRMMVLWCQHYPLSLFADAYFKNPEAVEKDLLQAINRKDIPIQPVNPQERAAMAKFLDLIRRRQTKVIAYQASILRQAMGEGLRIVANPHELPFLDMEGQGQVYDYPAVAMRPLLVDDDVFLRHYVSYFTQLFHDLTGKPPMISVRMNLSAASPRFVPRAALIQHWYDQAVRSGAGAFYFWTRDYPYADDPSVYDGPMPGNTDPGVIGKERWQTVIDELGWLSTKQRFIPPQPEVLILIPDESALLLREDWRRIYSVYAALSEAKFLAGFVSDRTIAGQGVPQSARLLLAPTLEFVSPALRKGLESFTARGGNLLILNPAVSDETGKTARPILGARPLSLEPLELFPLTQKAKLEDLQHLADVLSAEGRRAAVDPLSWVFDVSCANLPASSVSLMRKPEPGLRFDPWLYEHGSPWIMPFTASVGEPHKGSR